MEQYWKFSTLVAFFNPLKLFQKFIWMFNGLVNILYNSCGQAIKYSWCYNPSRVCKVAKLHTSILYLITVVIRHLIGWNYI